MATKRLPERGINIFSIDLNLQIWKILNYPDNFYYESK